MSRVKGLIIAIDGPSGAGKSTVSRLLADRMGYLYLDTGAMYRAVAYRAGAEGIVPEDEASLKALMERMEIELKRVAGEDRVLVNGTDISAEIRSEETGMLASRISAIPAVRDKLVEMQRKLGEQGGVVMEGRDIGTVVFPEADLKVYLDASPGERARRRVQQLMEKGEHVDRKKTEADIRKRDHDDSTRNIAPLRKAENAVVIDSDGLAAMQVVDRIQIHARDVQEVGS